MNRWKIHLPEKKANSAQSDKLHSFAESILLSSHPSLAFLQCQVAACWVNEKWQHRRASMYQRLAVFTCKPLVLWNRSAVKLWFFYYHEKHGGKLIFKGDRKRGVHCFMKVKSDNVTMSEKGVEKLETLSAGMKPRPSRHWLPGGERHWKKKC